MPTPSRKLPGTQRTQIAALLTKDEKDRPGRGTQVVIFEGANANYADAVRICNGSEKRSPPSE
jgi:hypothetical protein